ncbi:MAG: Uma2 family endonuclease [Ardenticatenaceae bacterium]
MTETLVAIDDKPTRLKMSYREFLEWSDEDTHAEWVDGEVTVFMPPKDIHQATLGFLYYLLRTFVGLFDLGQLRAAPYEMRASESSSREPDILFVAKANQSRLTEDRLEGPADLIIEIVSNDSARRDRHDKYHEYAEAGVPEYWIIDPRAGKQRADFFRLSEQGQYELYATEDDELVASHVLPGFALRPAWLWEADTLDPLTCSLQIEGVAAALARKIEEQKASSIDK